MAADADADGDRDELADSEASADGENDNVDAAADADNGNAFGWGPMATADGGDQSSGTLCSPERIGGVYIGTLSSLAFGLG